MISEFTEIFEFMQAFGVMSAGVAFLVMIGSMVILVAGLLASGVVSINIEIDEKKPKDKGGKDGVVDSDDENDEKGVE